MQQTTPPQSTFLDRELPVARWVAHGGPWAGLLGLALAVRLLGWRAFPLSPTEATLASDAATLIAGGDLSSQSWSRPLPTLAAAASFFLFGPGDGAARLPSLLAGLFTIALLARLIGSSRGKTDLPLAILLALSPTLVVASTRLDGSTLLAFALVASGALLRGRLDASRVIALGIVSAFLPSSHPLGWLLLLLVAALLVARNPRSLFPWAVSTAATLVLLSTVLLTRPAGLALFVTSSVQDLWESSISTPFDSWSRPIVLLASDEFPLAVFALLGLVDWARRGARWSLVAVVASLFFLLAFGGGKLTAFTLLVTVLAVPASAGLRAVLTRIPVAALRRPWDLAALGTSLLVLFAFLSLLGRLLSGPTEGFLIWLLGLVSLGLVLTALLWLARLVWAQAEAAGRTLLLLPLVALGALAMRNATLANATTVDRPGTLLHVEDSSPGLRAVVNRIRLASERLTMFQFDPRDPTGGHGLGIVLHEEVAQPFAWYLRDFPNLKIESSSDLATANPTAQVIVVPPDWQADVATARPDLRWQPVPARLTPPPSLDAPQWSGLVRHVVDPRAWREYLSFLLYRRVSVLGQPSVVMVGLTPEVANEAGYPAIP